MRSYHMVGLLLLPVAFATPSMAGMTKDLADCTAADRPSSAAACTRVLESGRLPRSQHYIAHYNRGWSHYNAGNYDEALADLDAAVEHNSGYADTYYSRSVIHHRLGNSDRARDDLNRYLELKGKSWTAYYLRAQMYRRLDDTDRALADLKQAAALKPSESKVGVLRALVLSDKGDHSAARTEIDKVLADGDEKAGAYYARALISYRDRQLPDAARDAEKAVSLQSDHAAAQALLGRIREDQGDTASAKTHYERALAAPTKTVDIRTAQEEARKRLDGMTSKTAEPAPVTRAAGLDCRRFSPVAGVTIGVACPP